MKKYNLFNKNIKFQMKTQFQIMARSNVFRVHLQRKAHQRESNKIKTTFITQSCTKVAATLLQHCSNIREILQ